MPQQRWSHILPTSFATSPRYRQAPDQQGREFGCTSLHTLQPVYSRREGQTARGILGSWRGVQKHLGKMETQITKPAGPKPPQKCVKQLIGGQLGLCLASA